MEKAVSINRLNLISSCGIIAFYLYLLAILPLYLLPISLYWSASLIPFFWLPITHWALIHEAIHKHFINNSIINDYAGRLLAILMGVAFDVLKFGHLMHHKLNRRWQSEIVRKNNFLEKIQYYYTLFAGLYLSELFSSLSLSLLRKKTALKLVNNFSLISNPEVKIAGERFFYIKNRISNVRVDTAIIIVIYSFSFAAYAQDYWVLLAYIIIRAAVLSFMDNIYHYGTRHDEVGKDLRLHSTLEKLILNSNYHATHHLNQQIIWQELPETHKKQNRPFYGNFLSEGLQQLNGPIAIRA